MYSLGQGQSVMGPWKKNRVYVNPPAKVLIVLKALLCHWEPLSLYPPAHHEPGLCALFLPQSRDSQTHLDSSLALRPTPVWPWQFLYSSPNLFLSCKMDQCLLGVAMRITEAGKGEGS